MNPSTDITPPLRRTGLLDALINEVDRGLQVLSGAVRASRPNPAGRAEVGMDASLSAEERRHAAGLMRVNHVGEVCAQALYRGQAAMTRNPNTRALLEQAAAEEVDHLGWLSERLDELGARPSLLNPLWYAGAFSLGLLAGRVGDSVSLGFMAETERQVEAHLDTHLDELPANDLRSRRIVEQMCEDEREHRLTAQKHGGIALPAPVRAGMKASAKVMTTTAYHL
ncbi:2-polyprenyl-3-methyl-6-methoxy-1,4-benzoquinone monooxygenase [Pigmentiphaga aceris]|uniref:3-demethoxyubiquinol 3-hydroxylase n=1 Tax=Pigmentiphaga aceris TaxID=1940612 RepID=A0A5C0AUT9_9BURK|nr:2-polyprenyl-3-methyl-6-methoxy-1,4-benzoquinone monooxygenase [Pigmentiphaga aceris]QEI05093.1 2-polyprenyl-3-methyl-6-methoxy-1,4-benzoquinone monooxygenase [Pigmentiphaga aceris]